MSQPEFALLFDMDGVIVDSNPAHKKAIHLFCENHSVAVTEEFLQRNVYGRTNKEWIPEVFGRALGSEELNNYADEKESMFREIFKSDLFPVKGYIPFIDRMKAADVKMVVATSAPAENAEFILNGLHIKSYFENVLSSADVDKGKPHPEVYVKAAKSIEMAPENCVVVEDSLAGVKAGLAAGCKVIGVTTTHTAEELEGCDLIIDDFDGLNVEDVAQLFVHSTT